MIKFNKESWQDYYLNLELSLLAQLGFRLDLYKCAAKGVTENLHFISPKTGRAISKVAVDYYSNKLLPFPQMLRDAYNNNLQNSYSFKEFQSGLRVIGFFF